MKHFRAPDPSDALPNYAGLSFPWKEDEFYIAIDGLLFPVEIEIDCQGEAEGMFFPAHVTVKDARGNWQAFSYGGSARSSTLGRAVFTAINQRWPSIEAWLVEKAEEER